MEPLFFAQSVKMSRISSVMFWFRPSGINWQAWNNKQTSCSLNSSGPHHESQLKRGQSSKRNFSYFCSESLERMLRGEGADGLHFIQINNRNPLNIDSSFKAESMCSINSHHVPNYFKTVSSFCAKVKGRLTTVAWHLPTFQQSILLRKFPNWQTWNYLCGGHNQSSSNSPNLFEDLKNWNRKWQ